MIVPDGLVTTFKKAWETANLDPALEGQRTKTALAEVLDALPELGWTPPEEMVYVGTPDGNNGYEIPVSESMGFTCGQRLTCTECGVSLCANPDHPEYVAEGPHEGMRLHKAYKHSGTQAEEAQVASTGVEEL